MYICICIYIYIIYIYIYGNKKNLPYLRVANLASLKQRFDDCLFEVSFYLYNFFIVSLYR